MFSLKITLAIKIEQRIGAVLITVPRVVKRIEKKGEEKKEIANKTDIICLFFLFSSKILNKILVKNK